MSSDPTSGLRPETLAVVRGRPPREVDAPLNQPPVFAATYVGAVSPAGEMGYGRYGNPSWSAVEDAVGALDGGRALSYASGMAAVHAVLELVPPAATVVLPDACYLGVSALLTDRRARYGGTVRLVDVTDTAAVLAACEGADLLWVESPTNPLMQVADLAALGAGRPAGCLYVVDSTFATPLGQRALDLGADVVVHAATKFLSGHSDALQGIAVVRPDDDERYAALERTRRLQGAVPGPMDSYLVLRGLRTLPLRLRAASANAADLAGRLEAHPAVHRVRWPGTGSLLSIELADAAAADTVVTGVRLWVHATSLGGVESMLERRRRWAGELPSVPEGLLRLSVGVEHVDDLWADLDQALRLAL
jgi:cystathionine gamma-synthase